MASFNISTNVPENLFFPVKFERRVDCHAELRAQIDSQQIVEIVNCSLATVCNVKIALEGGKYLKAGDFRPRSDPSSVATTSEVQFGLITSGGQKFSLRKAPGLKIGTN